MKYLLIGCALAASTLVTPVARAQGGEGPPAPDPLTAIFGGITQIVFGPTIAPPDAPREVAKSDDFRANESIPKRGSDRLAVPGQRSERGYVQTTVRGRSVLVDPRTRRIVDVLD